jgi:hypothetical protein
MSSEATWKPEPSSVKRSSASMRARASSVSVEGGGVIR